MPLRSVYSFGILIRHNITSIGLSRLTPFKGIPADDDEPSFEWDDAHQSNEST
jgi:hypothetical protein